MKIASHYPMNNAHMRVLNVAVAYISLRGDQFVYIG